MHIVLYFGSFNPVHVGHLIIANHVANLDEVDQVWMVVSPQNPLKSKDSLLNEYHRLHLVNLAIEGNNQIKVSDVEYKLPRPSYTIDTLMFLTEKYPAYKFSLLIGSDSFQNLSKWKNATLILDRFDIYVFIRPGFEVDKQVKSNIHILKAPKLDISSTTIRQLLKANKSIRYLVTEAVNDEILRNNYYK